MANAGSFKKGEKRPGQGRPKGMPNKHTQELKDMIRQALDDAGGPAYLASVAQSHPPAFCALIAKIIPADVKASLNVTGGLVLIPAKQ